MSKRKEEKPSVYESDFIKAPLFPYHYKVVVGPTMNKVIDHLNNGLGKIYSFELDYRPDTVQASFCTVSGEDYQLRMVLVSEGAIEKYSGGMFEGILAHEVFHMFQHIDSKFGIYSNDKNQEVSAYYFQEVYETVLDRVRGKERAE